MKTKDKSIKIKVEKVELKNYCFEGILFGFPL